MAQTIQLLEYVQAVSAGGVASATIGPRKYGDQWVINTLSTTTNSTTESILTVYRGAAVATAKEVSTYSGNNDTASGNAIKLSSSDRLVFQWVGATDGAICTCRITGELISERM